VQVHSESGDCLALNLLCTPYVCGFHFPTAAGTKSLDAATKPTAPEPAIVNPKSYQPRLGLARALARNEANLQEAKKYYTEVINMAPDVSSPAWYIVDIIRF